MPNLTHPYRGLTGGQWLRGNLHAHTNRTDGKHAPQKVINDYARLGHDFLMLSDHDVYTSAKDYRRYDSKGLILIPGNEITANGPHVLHVGADRLVAPSPLRQQVINDANAGKGFVIVAHPNWKADFNHCPLEKMQEWIDYAGMEIYNGVVGFLQGSPYATGKWDMLLNQGRRIWGFANDDSHRIPRDLGLGWNVAYVKRRTAGGVVEALRAGRFYASTGVEIEKIQVRGMRIKIQTSNACRIVCLGPGGTRLTISDDREIEVTVPDALRYVRFECWGQGDQFAWTQPFFAE
jgi:hypothetical protein